MPQPEPIDAEVEAIDLALVAFFEDGRWQLSELREGALDNVDSIVHELLRYPDAAPPVAMLAVDEDFVILVRASVAETQVLLSDVAAVTDWTLARSVVEAIGVHVDEDEDGPYGDLGLLADFGVDADELEDLLTDEDLYPDEVLADVADWIGLGAEFDELTGSDE